MLHLRLGENPDAQIWINHPGETIHSGYGRPSYWGGSGTLPRVHQYRGLAVAVFDCAAEQPDFTHAWFPREAFDETGIDGKLAFARSGRTVAMLSADRPFELVTRGPTAGNELRVPGRKAVWIVRLGATGSSRSVAGFVKRFSPLSLRREKGNLLVVMDPEYGEVRFHAERPGRGGRPRRRSGDVDGGRQGGVSAGRRAFCAVMPGRWPGGSDG